MIKRKTFYGIIDNDINQKKFDGEVNIFIEELSNNGGSIIHCNTIGFNTSSAGYLYKIRTEIIYIETPTRKVLTEKENKNE